MTRLSGSGSRDSNRIHSTTTALEQPEIKGAPYIVVFCHMPLLPGGGSWQSHCNKMWAPLFERYGVQLVVTAHWHKFRFDAPTAQRSWAHVVGGSGCEVPLNCELTVLEGKVSGGQLQLIAHNLNTGTTLGEYAFKPRTV